jgi:hypothetical protein
MFPSRKYVLYFRLQLLLYIALTCWSFCTSPLSEDYLLLLLFQRILFIILPVIYLLKMYQTSEYMRLTQTPYFFLNISVLIYNVSTLFLSFFEKYIRYDQESLELFFCLWPFYNLGGAVFYVLFSIGLWKLRIRKVAAPK